MKKEAERYKNIEKRLEYKTNYNREHYKRVLLYLDEVKDAELLEEAKKTSMTQLVREMYAKYKASK